MQYNMIIKMTLKNKLLMIIFLCLLFSFIFTVNAFASQGPSIFDVKASAINIRTGPSLSYSIISVQPNDADFPQFTANYPNDLAPVSGSGYDWLKVYYPNASYGEYTNLAVGWAAWYPIDNMADRYINSGANNCKVISSSPISLYSSPSLTNAYSGTYSSGTYLAAFDNPIGLSYELGYPNAWRISRPNTPVGESSLSFGNGWKLNAAPN